MDYNFLKDVGIAIVLGGAYYAEKFFIKRKEQKKNQEKEKKDQIAESIKTNVLVQDKVQEILKTYEADRVYIMQFHNGGNFYPTGKSIHKFSIFYEYVNSNTTSIRESFQNVPVSLFSKSTNRLLEEDLIEIYDFNDKSIETHGLTHIAELNDVKSSYMFAIKAINGKFIGILGIDYTKRKKKLEMEKVNDLCIEASSIGGVLMNLLNDLK